MNDQGHAFPVSFSSFAKSLTSETAFDVLAVARALKAQGKDVVELQIGDSPFTSTRSALNAGGRAIQDGATHYCPSLGLMSFRETLARNYTREFGVDVTAENIVIGAGAKIFEQFFCEAVLDPGDSVLVFSPHFPTYPPNILRRGARIVYSALRLENAFRPELDAVEQFLKTAPRPRAIFLNSPHNPTGGVATHEDMQAVADLVRGRDVAVFSDEPYCHMVWSGRHETFLAQPGMIEQSVAAYTFSKSYSMSGWRLGYAVASARMAQMVGKMINTSISCVPPLVQLAGQAAIENDAAERDEVMQRFRKKVELLVVDLRRVEGVKVLMPAGTFYVFPDVSGICRRLGIQSHGLAMYLLEGADDRFGVACLGGECFGPAGQGFLRFSCAEPDERLRQAMSFFADAITRSDRVKRYLAANPKYRLTQEEPALA
jgi:aspartate aminotransferase